MFKSFQKLTVKLSVTLSAFNMSKMYGKINRLRPATTGKKKLNNFSEFIPKTTSSSSMQDSVTDDATTEEKQRSLTLQLPTTTTNNNVRKLSLDNSSSSVITPRKDFAEVHSKEIPQRRKKQSNSPTNSYPVHSANNSNVEKWSDVVAQIKIKMKSEILGITSSCSLKSQFVTTTADGCANIHQLSTGTVLSTIIINGTSKSKQRYQASMTKEGNLLVASGDSVTLWSTHGRLLQEYGRKKFKFCKNIHLHDDEIIAATDPDRNCGAIMSLGGNWFHQLGSHGNGKGEFHCPTGVTILNNGDVVIADWSCRIQVFDRLGRFKFQFGGKGRNDGELDLPYGLTHDTKNNIVIADWWNNRVSAFRSDGKFLKHLLTSEHGINMPTYVCIPEYGNQLIVSEFGNCSFKIFQF